MITFVLLVAIIIIACLAIMLRPLLKSKSSNALDRDSQNILFARNRLAELKQQLENKEIDQKEYEALRLEIETSLLHDINITNDISDTDEPSANKESNAVLITLLCTLIPFATLFVYQVTGTPAALISDNISTPENAIGEKGVDELIAGVEQRLQENPNDLQGWTILAQTYLTLGRYQDAIKANQNILQIAGESAAVYTQLADASAMLAGGNLAGQPNEYLQKALSIDAQYPQALWLAGLGAAQIGDTQTANSHWNKLLPLLANSPQQQQELREIIAQTNAETAQLEPNIAQQAQAQEIPTDGDTVVEFTGLTVQVSLDPNIQSQTDSTDSVFVFARAKNGPPAPLAVKRLTISDLPATVSLSDNDAMIEQFKLSLFENVVVVARVSKSGNPIAQVGDFESLEYESSNSNDETIELIISELVAE